MGGPKSRWGTLTLGEGMRLPFNLSTVCIIVGGQFDVNLNCFDCNIVNTLNLLNCSDILLVIPRTSKTDCWVLKDINLLALYYCCNVNLTVNI